MKERISSLKVAAKFLMTWLSAKSFADQAHLGGRGRGRPSVGAAALDSDSEDTGLTPIVAQSVVVESNSQMLEVTFLHGWPAFIVLLVTCPLFN